MYGFGDYYDGYGVDAAHGISPPPAPPPQRGSVPAVEPRLPAQFLNPATGRPWRAGDEMPPVDLRPKPVVANKPAAAPVNYAPQMAAWKQTMRTNLTRPYGSYRPATSARSSSSSQSQQIGGGHAGGAQAEAETSARQERPQYYPQPMHPIDQMRAQHFGQHNDMIKGVNDAMSTAAQQWSDAAQYDASRQHDLAMQNNALNAGIQLKQMDMARDAHKYNVLSGLLRGITGRTGIQTDGQGNVSYT